MDRSIGSLRARSVVGVCGPGSVFSGYPAMRAFTDSFKTTQSVNFTTVLRIPLKKHTFLYGKNDCHSLKKIFWYHGATT